MTSCFLQTILRVSCKKSLTCLISGVPVFILAPARRAKSRLLLRPCCLMQVTSNFGQMLNTPISWNSSILVDIPRSFDFIAFPTMAILSPIGLIPMNVADNERWYMKSWSYLKLTDKDLNQVRKILQYTAPFYRPEEPFVLLHIFAFHPRRCVYRGSSRCHIDIMIKAEDKRRSRHRS